MSFLRRIEPLPDRAGDALQPALDHGRRLLGRIGRVLDRLVRTRDLLNRGDDTVQPVGLAVELGIDVADTSRNIGDLGAELAETLGDLAHGPRCRLRPWRILIGRIGQLQGLGLHRAALPSWSSAWRT
jgi:hypothetical protein